MFTFSTRATGRAGRCRGGLSTNAGSRRRRKMWTKAFTAALTATQPSQNPAVPPAPFLLPFCTLPQQVTTVRSRGTLLRSLAAHRGLDYTVDDNVSLRDVTGCMPRGACPRPRSQLLAGRANRPRRLTQRPEQAGGGRRAASGRSRPAGGRVCCSRSAGGRSPPATSRSAAPPSGPALGVYAP